MAQQQDAEVLAYRTATLVLQLQDFPFGPKVSHFYAKYPQETRDRYSP